MKLRYLFEIEKKPRKAFSRRAGSYKPKRVVYNERRMRQHRTQIYGSIENRNAAIQKAFREEIPGVTKIIIAQRISSVSACDRILVLDKGKVSGFDTHENLLKHNAIYHEIYTLQNEDHGDFDEPRSKGRKQKANSKNKAKKQ